MSDEDADRGHRDRGAADRAGGRARPRSGATASSAPRWARTAAAPAVAAEAAHRDVRDRVSALLAARSAAPVKEEGGYALPFPILSAVDAAALGVVLEDGVARAWVRVLDQAAQRATRELAVGLLSAAEVRAVAWRTAAHKTPGDERAARRLPASRRATPRDLSAGRRGRRR